jgi:uncharacterized membrane protein
MTLPADFTAADGVAIVLIFLLWSLYNSILKIIGKGSLNSQLHAVRRRWMAMVAVTGREHRTFDAVMLGHITNATAFFGSATLIVLASVFGLLANVRSLHETALGLSFLANSSLELFSLRLAVLAAILAIAFFSFVYTLRKIAYTLALIGGLGDAPPRAPEADIMVAATATVLTEAIKSLNNGIRGYYFAFAALFLFVGPYVCIFMTLAMSALLYYRQALSRSALAVVNYVEALRRIEG